MVRSASYFLLLSSVSFQCSETSAFASVNNALHRQTLSTTKTTSALFMSANNLPEETETEKPSPDAAAHWDIGLDSAFPSKRNSKESEQQRLRREKEERTKARFLMGDDLFASREKVTQWKKELNDLPNSDSKKVIKLQRSIVDAQKRDAEVMYSMSLDQMTKAETEGNKKEVEKWYQEAKAARSSLPQFNLEGLWIGKYGDHGYEMINVTYAGDLLVAKKVTGDKNVPRGEVTFTVDLTPKPSSKQNLEPIALNEAAAKQWGTKFLERFVGKGQVAAEGFTNKQWMEGQLILVGAYFSFAWVPIGHQVFFGRPSPELTLKMLRQTYKIDQQKTELECMREQVAKSWEETELIEEETGEGSIYFLQQGSFE